MGRESRRQYERKDNCDVEGSNGRDGLDRIGKGSDGMGR